MIDASSIPAEKLRFTMRMIRDRALARGWKVWLYYVGSPSMRLERTDGKVLEVFSATPPTTSYVAAHRANDKFFTHVFLEQAGLPLPETYRADTLGEATEFAQRFTDTARSYVVKPLDAGHGNGITVGVNSIHDLPAAFAYAKEYADVVVLQEYITDPIDLRIVCIDYMFVAALVRVPANVRGDGVHTVQELIDSTNLDERRGENYAKALNRIDMTRAQQYLGDRITGIPDSGAYVQVLGTANVGTGGETIDVTDDIPQWLRDMAQKAAKAMQLPSCGVDFLLSRMPKPSDTLESLPAKIIEINKCPALFLHETPTQGVSRPVTDAYLDYLATL